MNSREKDVQAKQEAGDTIDHRRVTKISSTTSRQWAGFKNPRIVRVSRAFGGKDRHSKVCTVKGLRDRRIRLSVPTAIQLYDLQDKLGLNQPSKVVDWLLDATKHDIDKLPPLQMPLGNFITPFINQPAALFSQEPSMAAPQASLSHLFNANTSARARDGGININDHDQSPLSRSRFWASDAAVSAKCKEAAKDKWNTNPANDDQENLDNYGGYVAQLSAQNLFPVANQSSSFPGVLNSTALPYNSYFHWEPSSLSLSPFGNHSFASHTGDHSHNNQPSSMAIPSGSHQLYFCPPVTTVPSMLPPPYPPCVNTSVENEPRQINHLQLLSSSSSQHVLPNALMPTLHLINSPVKSLSLNKVPPSQELDDNCRNKSK